MTNGKHGEDPLRRQIRADLAANARQDRFPAGAVAIAAVLMLLLLPAIAILVHLWISGGFTEVGAFLDWLLSCMGGDCAGG